MAPFIFRGRRLLCDYTEHEGVRELRVQVESMRIEFFIRRADGATITGNPCVHTRSALIDAIERNYEYHLLCESSEELNRLWDWLDTLKGTATSDAPQ